MSSLAVVEDLDVGEQLIGQVEARAPPLPVQQSICMDDQNDSIIALSSPSLMVPNEGIRPAERTLLVKAYEVNWTPWSARCRRAVVCGC